MSGVQVERRCGMVTGATCRNVGLSWLPAGGRHGTRTWVLSCLLYTSPSPRDS